ncbi:MAG: hypothetical protein H6839_01345 [Planctomycetes bacterium]|nr:hypothetical protein [Planctomycetota bacterium]
MRMLMASTLRPRSAKMLRPLLLRVERLLPPVAVLLLEVNATEHRRYPC